MPQAQVKIQYVNKPKQEGWSASIKDATLGYISIQEDQMEDFEVGKSYNIIYLDKTSKAGKPVRVFQEFLNRSPQQPTKSEALQAKHAPQPSASHYNGSNRDDSTERHIFITGVVGRWGGSGKFSSEDMLELTMAASQAYDVVFRGKSMLPGGDDDLPEERPGFERADMDDEILF